MLCIQGCGAVQPDHRVFSDELDQRAGQPIGWTAQRFGIISRAVAEPRDTSSALGPAAAERALEAAD